MKLAVSHIAWLPEEEAEALRLARQAGLSAVEAAPGRIAADPGNWQAAEATAWRERVREAGLECVAFQALLFANSAWQLFNRAEHEAALGYLERVAGLAAAVGARVLVFGSPKQRSYGPEWSEADAYEYAVEFFRGAGERVAGHGVALGLEANPPAYGGNFIHSTGEAAELVRRVGHDGFRLHLDAGTMALLGEDPAALLVQHAELVCHVHASEPMLAPLANAPLHEALARALRSVDYAGAVSLEMRRPEGGLAQVAESWQRLREWYA